MKAKEEAKSNGEVYDGSFTFSLGGRDYDFSTEQEVGWFITALKLTLDEFDGQLERSMTADDTASAMLCLQKIGADNVSFDTCISAIEFDLDVNAENVKQSFYYNLEGTIYNDLGDDYLEDGDHEYQPD